MVSCPRPCCNTLVSDLIFFLLLYKRGRLTCLERKETRLLLNSHAGVVSSRYETGTELFEILFDNFIEELVQSGFCESDLDVKSTGLALAHKKFMNCLGPEVKRSKPPTRH